MNRLQNIESEKPLFVTRILDVHPALEHCFTAEIYDHPSGLDAKAIAAQRKLWLLQGNRKTWFCGAYFGAGFMKTHCRWASPSLSNSATCDDPGRCPTSWGDCADCPREPTRTKRSCTYDRWLIDLYRVSDASAAKSAPTSFSRHRAFWLFLDLDELDELSNTLKLVLP